MKKQLLTPLLTFFFFAVAMNSNAQWNLTGNANATATSILGTTNAIPLNLTTNNVQRLVIDANGKVGIGIAAPPNVFSVKGSGGVPSSVWTNAGAPLFTGFGEQTIGNADYILSMASSLANARPVFIGRRARGTLATPTVVSNNDQIMSFMSSGFDGTGFQNPAAIDFFVDGTPTAGNVPARISFVTGTNGATRAERLKIGSTGDITVNTNQLFVQSSGGNVGLGTTTPLQRLHVNGSSLTTVNALVNGAVVIDASNTNDGTLATGGSLRFGNAATGEAIISKRTSNGNQFGIDFLTGAASRVSIANNGNVGIGTTTPTTKLDVAGQVKIVDGTQGSAKVLTSDSTGLASWQAVPVIPETDPKVGSLTTNQLPKWNGTSLTDGTITDNGSVGIGTTTPAAKLDVSGNVKIADGTQAIGKVLTSDNTGLASWKAIPIIPETDPKVGSLSVNKMPKWNGTTLADGTITDNGNVGIGTLDPLTKLHVSGNLLVSEPLFSNTNPRDRTLINAQTLKISSFDSSDRLFDPGGPAGNYDNNISAKAFFVSNPDSRGFQVIIDSINLGSGDSLFIQSVSINPSATFLAVGGGKQPSSTFIINSTKVAVFFKSDANGIVGSGFSIVFKKLFPQPGQSDVSGYAGQGLSYNASKGFLRVGNPPFDETPGVGSAAFGFQTTASGLSSFASGSQSIATGDYAVAFGDSSRAIGNSSLATGYHCSSFGYNSAAIGYYNSTGGASSIALGSESSTNGYSSIAMGRKCSATGDFSLAMGDGAISTGKNSTALGLDVNSFADKSIAMGRAVTSTNTGAFIIGDASTSTTMFSSADNQMSMRFVGGYKLYSNTSHTTGVSLATGGGAWSNVSDRRLKENFRTINTEEVLLKLAAIPVTNWNYKSQPASQRHIGPMAQDFFAAFKLDGEGADTTINTMDINGVNMAAIQALEKRTAKLVADNKDLAKKNEELATNNAQLKNKDADLQKQLDDLKAIVSKLVNDRSALPCPPLAEK